MITLFQLLAQTKNGAVIEIIILLLIAGIIAYLTAYYYYKPIYTKKIDKLEDDVLYLQKENNNLKSEISNLDEKLNEKDKLIKSLRKEKEGKKK